MLRRVVLVLAIAALASANVYDFFMPNYVPSCSHGCAPWASAGGSNATLQKIIDAMFLNGSAAASNMCAMPGATAGDHECDCADSNETITDSFAGPWCYCLNPASGEADKQYCTPPNSIPEQINLQAAAPDVIVAGFVTYEDLPSDPPVAMIGESATSMTAVKGITHQYSPPGRTYLLHFVKFGDLKPRQTYFYKVKSGSANCSWSETFSFRASYSDGITRLATYGDMGHSHYNNMGNMLADAKAGLIDGIVHMGDHAYNMGMAKDARGDAYMNVFQPVLANVPWIPIIGNHEAADGSLTGFTRYENITWGLVFGQEQDPVHSTADSALGHLLTKGTMYAAGYHGSTPTKNSRYVSVDFGLIHIVALDLNLLDPAQIAWLEKDLTAANKNRDAVPWIMVMSHFPIYHDLIASHPNSSASHFVGDESEEYPTSGHEFFACDKPGCRTVGQWQDEISDKLEPILYAQGVDIYNAGHVHDYESTWPMHQSKACQTDFNNPKCSVHICEGNGGVPGVAPGNVITDCSDKADWCRKHGTNGAYGRITIFNATHLTYEHVSNSDSTVTDSWTIVQNHHGPFGSGKRV